MNQLAAIEIKALNLASENAQLKERNDALIVRADDLARRHHNKSRQATRARVSADVLRGALNRTKHSRTVQAGRLDRRKRDGIGKALTAAKISIG